jgi:predicted unusual protein kinase regulating ubiquinone biosynthesis (AarF/ABC1/UbiB family)
MTRKTANAMAKYKISTELLQSCENRVRQKYLVCGEDQTILLQLFTDLESARIQTEPDALEIYFCVLLALELNQKLHSIKDRDRERLLELAETCLGFCQIRPVTSHHSHLYLRLYQAMAQNTALSGQAWESTVQIMLGEYLGRDGRGEDEPSAWLRAQQAWMLGHLRVAKVAIHTALMHELGEDFPRHKAWQLLIRAYRLSGESEEALTQATAWYQEQANESGISTQYQWIQILSRLQKGADPKALHEFLQSEGSALDAFAVSLSLLWIGACPGRELWKDFSKWRTRKQKKTAGDGWLDFGWQLVSSLELLFDQSTALQQRFEILGKRLTQLHAPYDPECALLFLACSIRWLIRIKQHSFASVLYEEYRTQSLRLSEGRWADVLGVMRDMDETLPIVISKEAIRSQPKLYTGSTPRFLKIAQTMARCTIHVAKLYLKNLDPDAFQQQQKQVFHDFMKDFELVLGELKGPAMKIAQMIAASYFVDKDLQLIMQDIHEDARALPMPQIQAILERELGQSLSAVFQDFDPEPIAVASIGQVYRATTRDGREVAVKVKYPGIEDAVRSDMRLVKLFVPLLRQFFPADHLQVMIEQFTRRFERECDYREEALTQEKFAQSFADDPQICIPRVLKELSTDEILVTEFAEGTRLDYLIQTAGQMERDEAAKKIIRFSLLALLKHGIQHIDPNLANFIVTPDRIFVLDFGACVDIPTPMQGIYGAIMVSRCRGDHAALYELAMSLRLFDRKDMPYETFVNTISPSLMPPYAFDDERPFYEEGHQNIAEYFLKKGLTRKVQLDPRYVFTNAGSILGENVLARIGARINWHQHVVSVLAEIGLMSPDEKSA